MERLAELRAIDHIQEGLVWTQDAADYFSRVPLFLASPLWQHAIRKDSLEFLYFALWVVPLPENVQRKTVKRLRGRKTTCEDVLAVGNLIQGLRNLGESARPSQFARACRPYRDRVLLAARIVIGDEPTGLQLDRYYDEWRFVKAKLTGDDLRDLGLRPGPAFAVYLDRLLDARLDGLVRTEAEERTLLAQMLASSD
jgi:tRNA nucleotidyltransferase (CCA-adding enzyme)